MSESGEESKSRRSKCRNAECEKIFSTRSNRDRHEKKVILQLRGEILFKFLYFTKTFKRERVLLSKLSGHVKVQK